MEPTTPPPGKPEPESSATKKPKTKKASSPAPTKELPPLVNPAWASAIVKQYDVIGKTAELAVEVLIATVEKQVAKATKPEKLDKLVWGAITEAHRKARG